MFPNRFTAAAGLPLGAAVAGFPPGLSQTSKTYIRLAIFSQDKMVMKPDPRTCACGLQAVFNVGLNNVIDHSHE